MRTDPEAWEKGVGIKLKPAYVCPINDFPFISGKLNEELYALEETI